ncbi:MAG: hypothetical protein ABIP58_04075 [Dehalococcoidia bacterium]
MRLPSTVILDWTRTDVLAAEALAYFTVVARRMMAIGIQTIICMPSTKTGYVAIEGIVRDLVNAGARAVQPATQFSDTASLLASAASFQLDDSGQQSDFIEVCGEGIAKSGAEPSVREIAEALLREALQNARTHSEATMAAGAGLSFRRRRPRLVQVGIADDGIGVARSVLARGAHTDLREFADATIALAVVNGTLSGRNAGHGGGGFSLVLREALESFSARVTIRTGSALLRMEGADPTRWRIRHLTRGFGTQIRFEFPVLASAISKV